MSVYQQKYTVVASEMDFTYHVSPQAILLYFQDTFARYLTSKYVAAFDVIKQHLLWVITEFDLNFTKERPLWADDITVEMEFTEISSIRMYVDFRLLDKRGEVFAHGTSCWVIIDSVTKRPFSGTALMAQAGIQESGTPKTKIARAKSNDKVFFKAVEHQVNVTDLDFNGHMCNRSYVVIAMGTAPIDFIKNTSLQRMHVKFVREAFFGDQLTCNIYKGGEEADTYWHNFVNQEGKEVCTIYSEWKKNEGEVKDVSELIQRDANL